MSYPTKTEADELFTVLYHLRNARKALLRTGDWSNERDAQLAQMDRLYRNVQAAAIATKANEEASQLPLVINSDL